MKKENKEKYKVKVILCISLVLLGAGCLMGISDLLSGVLYKSKENHIMGEGSGNYVVEDTTGAEHEERNDARIPISGPLSDFGEYLTELFREGRRTELYECVISKRLSMEEAVLLSDQSPLLEHMSGYTDKHPNINTDGICILTADINGDGLEDIIEYGPDEEANMLAIYIQTNVGGYSLSYSQQVFDTRVGWNDMIDVVRYEEETYLLFANRTIQQNLLTVYWLSECIPQGKLTFTYECSDVKAEIIFQKDEHDVDWLVINGMYLYHEANGDHCNFKRGQQNWSCGDGENIIEGEELEYLEELFYQKYTEEQSPYWEKYEEFVIPVLPAVIDAYESDLNNDGIMEKYVKRVWDLYLVERGIPVLGLPSGIPFLTGEYYGIHEGRRGLWYCIEKSGEVVDFYQMCGLDIWNGEMTPQFFWVEKTEYGNVTYIIYQDENQFLQRVDGYLIQDGNYECISSVRYTPVIECRTVYEYAEEGKNGGIGYITNLTRDCLGIELTFGDANDLEAFINQEIREILEWEMSQIDLKDGYISAVRYWPIIASEEEYIMGCFIFYKIPCDTWDDKEYTSDDFFLYVNLSTGECRQMTRDELENVETGTRW